MQRHGLLFLGFLHCPSIRMASSSSDIPITSTRAMHTSGLWHVAIPNTPRGCDLTTFVFLDVLDSARVSAPWAQLVHHTNDTGIWLLLRALHITVLIEWELRKEQFIPLHIDSLETVLTSQSESTSLLLVGKYGVRTVKRIMASMMVHEDWSRQSPGCEEQIA